MNKRSLGADYEEMAARFLEENGMRILERNFRSRTGEIDMIAKDGRFLVFVEVKYRADCGMGSPLEAVDARKQKKIIQTAQYYLLKNGCGTDTPCRFDVVGIVGTDITHIKNAFWT